LGTGSLCDAKKSPHQPTEDLRTLWFGVGAFLDISSLQIRSRSRIPHYLPVSHHPTSWSRARSAAPAYLREAGIVAGTTTMPTGP